MSLQKKEQSIFERTDLFTGLSSKDLDESLYMSLSLSQKSNQEKGKKDAGTFPSYPKDHPGSKKGKRYSIYLLDVEEPVELNPLGLFREWFDPARACMIRLRAWSFSAVAEPTSIVALAEAVLPGPLEEGGGSWFLVSEDLLLEDSNDRKKSSRACCVFVAEVVRRGPDEVPSW